MLADGNIKDKWLQQQNEALDDIVDSNDDSED